jgi:type I restriction enzyme S subunit
MKKGWTWKRLSDLYKIGSSKRVLQSQWKSEGVPFYRGREVTRLAADGFVDNVLFISEKHFAELSKEYGVPKAGDIVITAIGTIGNSHVVRSTDRFYFKDASVLWMKRTAEVSSEFVNLWLKSPAFFDQLDRGNGATVDTLTIQKLQSVEIAVPPLAEQQRIVGLLDEAFEGLATAKANAEKNLQNARALFESYLQSVFTQRGPGWVETTLSRATDGIFTGPFGSLLHKSDYVVDGIPLVNPAHITEVGIEPDLRKTVSKATALRLKNYIMREGDIVIGRRGEMGRCAFVTGFENGWLCGTGSFFIKPSSRCNTRYLVRFLRSDSCKIRLEKIAGGAVMPNLSNTDLAISLSICRHSTGRRPSSKKSTPSTKKPNASPASTSGSSPRWRR